MDFEKVLKSRGLKGDDLLNAMDTITDILSVNGVVDEFAMAKLYHRTNKSNALDIVDTQYMITKEDCIYMSTHSDKQIVGYGNTVIILSVPVELLVLDDDFGDELHYKIMTKFKGGLKVNAVIL